jgi:hypothetical protein
MLNVKKQLYNDIELYCRTNGIDDVQLFCNQLLEKAFMAEKYGDAPDFVKPVEKKVEKKVETLVYSPEKPVSLPEPENVIEPVKEEPIKEEPKKVYKKANINDDYRVYDI